MQISYEQVKLGDQITYYLTGVNGGRSKIPTNLTMTATVIAIPKDFTTNNSFIIGWKPPAPNASNTSIDLVSSDGWHPFTLIDDFADYRYYDCIPYYYEVADLSSATTTHSPRAWEEKPCIGCSAMNDVGVKICWRCGGSDPTQSLRTSSKGYV